jgi:hypothetical protein
MKIVRNYVFFLFTSIIAGGMAFYLMKQGIAYLENVLEITFIEKGFLFFALKTIQALCGFLSAFAGVLFMFSRIQKPNIFLPFDGNQRSSEIIQRGALTGILLSVSVILLESIISGIALFIVKVIHKL